MLPSSSCSPSTLHALRRPIPLLRFLALALALALTTFFGPVRAWASARACATCDGALHAREITLDAGAAESSVMLAESTFFGWERGLAERVRGGGRGAGDGTGGAVFAAFGRSSC